MPTELYKPQFEATYDHPSTLKAKKDLLIGFTARSGSHMVGHQLHSIGVGSPFEYFNGSNFAEWQRLLGTTGVADTLAAIRERRTSHNGAFCTKLHWNHFDLIGGVEGLGRLFENPVIAYVYRKDSVSQAVSYSIAKQTGVFIAGQAATGMAAYNYDQILHCLNQILLEDAKWRAFLQMTPFQSYTIAYEDFLADPSAPLAEILALLNLDSGFGESKPRLVTQRQTKAINTEWKMRFAEEWTRRAKCDPGYLQTSLDPTSRVNHKQSLIRRLFASLRR